MALAANKTYLANGMRRDFAKYERDVIKGKIPCPFTIRFVKNGEVIRDTPIPLTPNGNPKIDIWE